MKWGPGNRVCSRESEGQAEKEGESSRIGQGKGTRESTRGTHKKVILGKLKRQLLTSREMKNHIRKLSVVMLHSLTSRDYLHS